MNLQAAAFLRIFQEAGFEVEASEDPRTGFTCRATAPDGQVYEATGPGPTRTCIELGCQMGLIDRDSLARLEDPTHPYYDPLPDE